MFNAILAAVVVFVVCLFDCFDTSCHALQRMVSLHCGFRISMYVIYFPFQRHLGVGMCVCLGEPWST